MSPEELFNHCLSELESPDTIEVAPLTGARFPSAIPHSIFHLTQPPANPLLLSQICINCRRFDVIKVMKSGIFHKGGLKGRPLTRNNFDYVVYFFKDLVSFILKTTSHLISEKPGEYHRYYISAFDRAINQIDRLRSIASSYRSKRSWNKLIKIKNDLEDIKSNLISKPVIALPTRLMEKEDCIDSLISLFKQQLPPTTPDIVISQAISTLLHTFNIFTVEPDAIRQRITRSKRK
ncbi:MAG: hypothetical protein NTY36_03235 [Deltaproteobacteria bacterium]|nr:hypothetical protein [Deltaproteobacteria bacterium]